MKHPFCNRCDYLKSQAYDAFMSTPAKQVDQHTILILCQAYGKSLQLHLGS